MQLNGLRTPDEVTLGPLNKIEPAQTPSGSNGSEDRNRETKNCYCFDATKLANSKQSAKNFNMTNRKKPVATTARMTKTQPLNQCVTPAAKSTNWKIVQ